MRAACMRPRGGMPSRWKRKGDSRQCLDTIRTCAGGLVGEELFHGFPAVPHQGALDIVLEAHLLVPGGGFRNRRRTGREGSHGPDGAAHVEQGRAGPLPHMPLERAAPIVVELPHLPAEGGAVRAGQTAETASTSISKSSSSRQMSVLAGMRGSGAMPRAARARSRAGASAGRLK